MAGLSYESSGVNYDQLDAFKRACQRAAATTTPALAAHGLSEPKDIRGESAYLLETPDEYLAHVEEGLGTKNLVADPLSQQGSNMQADAPACDVCGSITVRSGTCYKCLNCGNSMGCS